MRDLTAEERALWAKVTAAVRRLHAAPEGANPPPEPTPAPAPPPSPVALRPRGRVPPPRPVAPVAPPPRAATLDGSWDRRLASGKASVDRVIDLHGHDLDGAWRLIDRELEGAVEAGHRVLLLITGKPPLDAPPHARGRIRAAVGDWLHASRHRDRIAAVRPAAPRHGGAGALYVILRRERDRPTFP